MKSDRLSAMFDLHAVLSRELEHKRHYGDLTLLEQLQDTFVLGILDEVDEIRQILFTKRHKLQDSRFDLARDRAHLLEEIIDLQHYLIQLARIIGASADEFFERFHEKIQVNIQRARGDY